MLYLVCDNELDDGWNDLEGEKKEDEDDDDEVEEEQDDDHDDDEYREYKEKNGNKIPTNCVAGAHSADACKDNVAWTC